MNATDQRNKAAKLAKIDTKEAYKIALEIDNPWFRAQALYWIARYADKDVLKFITEGSKAASMCENYYKKVISTCMGNSCFS